MSERKLPWVIKYRPKKIADVVNQNDAKQLVLKWIKEWFAGRPSRKAALFYGPPGCGKTSLAEAVAREYGLEYLEMNASDYRRASDIERIAKIAVMQRGLFAKGKLILLDEVDGMSRVADRGAMEAILDLIKITKSPLVMTANDPWNPNLRPLRESVLLVPFRRLTKTDIKRALARICELERIRCDDDAIKYIANKAEGDLRSAINDLQAIAEGYGRVTLSAVKAVLRARDRVYEPFEVVRKIFISKYAWQAKLAASQTDLSPDELIQWINENLPKQISNPEDLWRAYDALSRADVYIGRIVRTGSWDLLAYAMELMTAGVSLAVRTDVKSKYRWVKYSFPQKILIMARTKEVRQIREDLAAVIARHLRISKRLAKSDVIPYLVAIFESNPEYAASLAVGLNLSDSMIKYLSQRNSNRIIELTKKIREQIAREAREESRKEPPEAEAAVKTEAEAPKTKKVRRRKKKEGAGLEAFFKK